MSDITFIQHPEQFFHTLETDRLVLLIDQNVHALYERDFDEFDRIIIPQGESSKSLRLIEELIEILLEKEIHRDSLIVGIGGGVVTDITGFVATIFKRGTRFGFIPTTLLAMCDAAIGGKNGINVANFKNVAGTIRKPEFIAVDTCFLDTLSEEEFSNGMAEVIKHAIISGKDLFQFLEYHTEQILLKDKHILDEMISRSVSVKQSIADADLFDHDQRHILNLGHTLAHAFEPESGLSHGYCVAAGICIDTKIAVNSGLTDENAYKRIAGLFKKFQLPNGIEFITDHIMQKIFADKKIREGYIRYILPVSPGDCRIVNFTFDELRGHLKRIENE